MELKKIESIDTLETLAGWIGQQCPVLEEAKRTFASGALAIGAAICIYADNAEVKKECAAYNKEKGRGRPFEPIGYVAFKLEQEFGDKVPAAKWMQSCAKAAAIAKEQKLINCSVRDVLGWQTGTRLNTVGEIEPGKLLGLKIAGEDGDDPEVDVAALMQAFRAKLVSSVESIIAEAGKAGKQIGKEHRKALIEEVNPTLEYLGLAIAPLPGNKHKSWAKLNAN